MSKILLHIGLHKTGTSTIQLQLESNRNMFPTGYSVLLRNHRLLHKLTRDISEVRSVEQARKQGEHFRDVSNQIARKYCNSDNTLISHEDIMGPIPTRGNILGLYPFVEAVLPNVLQGFSDAGKDVSVVLYLREYKDWLGSVYRYRFRDNPDRQFAPRRYKEKHQLPNDWNGFLERLNVAVAPHPIHVISFEEDRATASFGSSLYSLWGLGENLQKNMKPVMPQNVTDITTVYPDRSVNTTDP